MTLERILQLMAAMGGFISGLFCLGLLAGGYRHRFDRLEKNVDEMDSEIHGLKKAFLLLIAGLIKNKSVDQATSTAVIDAMHVRPTQNPINQEEADKINRYLDMFKALTPFTKEEAKEFFELAKKYDADAKGELRKTSFDVALAASVILGKYGE